MGKGFHSFGPEWQPAVADLPGDVPPPAFVHQAEDESAYRWRMAFAILCGANLGALAAAALFAWLLLWP
jgi:hypothetical protein